MKQKFLWVAIKCLFLFPTLTSWANEFENVPKMIVKGEASLYKPADQMEVSLGVLTTAENSSQALNENNRRMHQIIAHLQELGLDESDYQTGRFHIRPIYQTPSKGSEEDSRAIISHYEVMNSIQIKTQKMTLADKILRAAVQGGANQVEEVNFNITNPQSYRAEAIKLATENALADASALANAAGIKIIRVINLSLDHWQHFPRALLSAKQPEIYSKQNEISNVLEPGKGEIHAIVTMTLEIASK